MRLTAISPEFVVTGKGGFLNTARTYLRFGITHILGGYDHLLFLIALMLLIGSNWQMVGAVTGFTVSHSTTLCIGTGIFSLPLNRRLNCLLP